MTLRGLSLIYFIGVTACTTLFPPFVLSKTFCTYAQAHNSISGHVYGLNRQPVSELNTELLDDFGRTVSRTRTNASGYYEFNGVDEGNFSVRVYTFGTDYEEQESRVDEIVNINTVTSQGSSRLAGFVHEECDVYLKLHRGLTPASVAVFVQEVPPEAKKLYEKAIADIGNKHESEAREELRSAIGIFPRYFLALERLGTEYILLAKPETYQAAEILFKVAVDVNPRAYKSWYGLAYAEYSLRKFAEALTAVQKAIELNSYSPEAVFLDGVLMKHNSQYAEAEKQLLKARDLAKDTIPRIHWELALLYGNDMKRYADAARELKLFLKAQPEVQDAEKIKLLIADFEAKAQKK